MAETPLPTGQLPASEQPPVHPATRHERSDVTLPWFKIILVVSIVLAALVEGLMLWFEKKYEAHEARVKKSAFAYPDQRPQLPPAPRLEPIEPQAMTQAEGTKTSAAIHRAMKLLVDLQPSNELWLAGSGIPATYATFLVVPEMFRLRVRPAPTGRQALEDSRKEGGLVFEGGPNSGRLFREGQR